MVDILAIVFTNFMYSLVGSYLIDNLFKMTVKKSARYYLLHVILNSYIVYVTYRESIDFFLSPIIKYDIYTTSSIESASVIIGFHIYHYLTDTLDFETKIHHIVTVFITGSTALLIPTGSTTSAINFIMCGFPGGIDYILLVMYKYGIISTLVEKNINRWLNLLIRMPGMMLVAWYICLNIYNGNIMWYKYIPPLLATILMTINSIYYCNKTVGNFHVRYNQHVNKIDKIKSIH